MVLEHDDLLEALEQRIEPGTVDAVQPRLRDDLRVDAPLGEPIGRDERLVEHHRAVREHEDVRTLAERMGGTDVATERLDAFFRNPDGTFDLSAKVGTRFDATNEPDIQTPYLYNYFGAAYKTQETVKAIVDTKWSNGTGGIPGNDDAGTMSAWYVLSALGLYPTVPTRAELALTTPLFPRAVMRLGSGRQLTIDAPGTESAHYVQGLKVDGKATTRAWLPARTATTGGHLVYTLSSEPSLTWGSGPDDGPPQN